MSRRWFALPVGILAAVAALFLIAIGQPWEERERYAGITHTASNASGLTVSENTPDEPDATDNIRYGDTEIREEPRKTVVNFTEAAFGTSYRAIAGDYEGYHKRLKELSSDTSCYRRSGKIGTDTAGSEGMNVDVFAEWFADQAVSGRVEINCSFTPKYEIRISDYESTVNGFLNITVYSASDRKYLESLFGVSELPNAETVSIPFHFELLYDSKKENWTIQEFGMDFLAE